MARRFRWLILEIAGWAALILIGVSLYIGDMERATFNLVGFFYFSWAQAGIKRDSDG